MLFISLISSLVLLAIANLAIRLKHPLAIVGLCGLGLAFWPTLFERGSFVPPVLIQVCLLLVALGVWQRFYRSGWSLLALSLAATRAAYIIPMGMALQTEQEYARFRKE